MPDQSQTSPSAFVCEGGLIKSRSTFIMQPGQALELLNFEPDIEGGYRRINGFTNSNKTANVTPLSKVVNKN